MKQAKNVLEICQTQVSHILTPSPTNLTSMVLIGIATLNVGVTNDLTWWLLTERIRLAALRETTVLERHLRKRVFEIMIATNEIHVTGKVNKRLA
jgi:hypothetical protein